MPVSTELRHIGEWLVSEANGFLSREAATIASGATLMPGTILGLVTATGKYKQLTPAAADGSQNAAGILYMQANAATADVLNMAVFVRTFEYNNSEIIWPTGITTPQKATAIAQLAALGIRGR